MSVIRIVLPFIYIVCVGALFSLNAQENRLKEEYPERQGNLLFKTKHLAIDKFLHNSIRTDSLKILNDGDIVLQFDFSDIPPYLSCEAVPEKLAPGEKGIIRIHYDAARSGNWGLGVDAFRIKTNDKKQADKSFTIGVNIIEDFSLLTKEDLHHAPNIQYSSKLIGYGNVTQGEKAVFDFVFKNTGQEDLIIRKVKASCGCTATKPQKTRLKTGEESFVRITFNTAGYIGKQTKQITIVCNDPDDAVIRLSINANVVKPD